MNKPYFPLNCVRLCIDRTQNGDIAGRAVTPLEQEAVSFGNLVELLLRLDAVFDRHAYPAAFQKRRDFFPEAHTDLPQSTAADIKPQRTAEEILACHGEVCTLQLFVRYRRGTTWQGELLDENGGVLARFRSDLELMRAIEAAL